MQSTYTKFVVSSVFGSLHQSKVTLDVCWLEEYSSCVPYMAHFAVDPFVAVTIADLRVCSLQICVLHSVSYYFRYTHSTLPKCHLLM